jgi:hypothetical protein
MEKNLKFICKLPARTSQKRAHLIDLQCANRMVENLAIGTACREFLDCDPFDEGVNDNSDLFTVDSMSSEIVSSCTGGARYILAFDDDGDGIKRVVTVSSTSSVIRKSGVDLDLANLLGRNIIPFRRNNEVEVMCEHKRAGSTIFRAHPNYLNRGNWYDWAEFNWENEATGIPYPVLGRIYGFISLDAEFPFDHPDICESLASGIPGVFAIIHSCKDESVALHKYSKMLMKASLPMDKFGKKELIFVDVDSICAVATVVPNIGGKTGDVIHIKKPQVWASLF